MKTRLWLRPDILALAAATAILAFWWSVGAGRELWFDERFVQVVSRMKWPEMFDLLRYENNPPLFFFLANIWQRAVGSNEVALRILTLAPTIGLLAVIRSLANKLAGSHIAALSVILTSVSGMVVAQAGEFRMYPWLTLWAALALL
ncbi:MAG: hypothetical protein HY420_01495, partial [Candidatus Kerfeldbacteria bacterium]|nr:hypothetical protein [Candidatus Kerfeldbacteria bacterium]